MTTQLSSLAVRPDLDPSKFVQGVQQLDSAAASAGKAVAGIGVASDQVNRKISQAGDVVGRLSRQYVDGYASAQRFQSALNTLSREMEKGNLTINQAQPILDGIYRKYGLVGDASQIAAKGQVELAAAITNANAKVEAQGTAFTHAIGAHQVYMAQLRSDQAADAGRQIAAANQNRFNSILGVSPVSSNSAQASASVFQAEFDQIEAVAQLRARQIGSAFVDDFNAAIMAGSGKSARASAQVFETAFGEDDQMAARVAALRAELDPLAAAQNRVNAEIAEYSSLAARGAISAEELSKAEQLARSRLPANGNARMSSGMTRMAGFNAGQQVQDIVMMAALGQSPMTMALQQGPQLASAIEMGGGVGALKTGLMSLLSPTMGITIALTAAAGAAVQFGSAILNRGKSVEEILKGHKALIDEITKAYPQAAAAAKQYEDQASRLPQTVLVADASKQISDERAKLQSQLSYLEAQMSPVATGRFGNLIGDGTLAKTLNQMSAELHSGAMGAAELQERLGVLRIDPALTPTAKSLLERFQGLAKEAAEFESRLQGATAAASALRGVTVGRGDEGTAMQAYLNRNADTMFQLRRRRAVDLSTIGARSPEEMRKAAEARERANPMDPNESAEVRNYRIETAGAVAYAQAQHQLNEAQKERKRSLDATLASQRLDLDLIGKTTGQAEALRLQFQLTQQLREDAARNNIPVDQKALDLIRQKAEAYGKMADAIARAKLGDDLAFERSQIFRGSDDQAIAARLRGTGLGMDSPEAQTMRQNQQLSELKTASQSFVSTFASTLQSSGGKIGNSFGAALLAGLQNYEQKAIEQLGNLLFNILSSALGMSPTGGAGGGGIAGAATGIVGKILSGANDNYTPGAVTRALLPPIGATGSAYSVASATGFIRQYASAIGIDPDTALKVARGEGLGSGIWQSNLYRNGIREPSFGPFQLLKGGPGTGFGTGLGNKFMSQTGLDPADPANWQRSTAFALDQAKLNGWGDWYGAKAQGITGFMGIDRGASNAIGALDKLASSSVDTATSLTSGLGSLGKNLANVFPAAPAGGGGVGIFGFLGSLLGGGRSLSATAMAAVAGGTGGLYDVGGFTGHGGKYDVAGYVHRGEFVFDAAATSRIGVSNLERLRKLPGYDAGGYVRALPAANGNSAGGSLSGLDIKIGWAKGASGMLEPAISDVVKRDAPGIARQQSQGAIADYHENQRRGGFGTLQHQYAAQKG